ncbi:hypothetical protein ACPPVO_49475 [Dactylosporangium sp. McL0621]|uniref:hypothetical protein n=1 Tax=Dactylosporangium sp. McL0621 TaxID=3415678 RepID=UPI003CEFE8C6
MARAVGRRAATISYGVRPPGGAGAVTNGTVDEPWRVCTSAGSGPGRSKSQPCPSVAPMPSAASRCSRVSTPSASSAAPARSA